MDLADGEWFYMYNSSHIHICFPLFADRADWLPYGLISLSDMTGMRIKIYIPCHAHNKRDLFDDLLSRQFENHAISFI